MGCGGFILRYGALRMTQVGMLALGIGLAVTTAGWLPLFAAGAFMGGLGQALSTPSSSHLLGRLSPRHLAPLVFSIKQTGVPAGLMLAGVVAPVLVVEAGWRTALLVVAGLCLLTVVALQPLRARFDTDRNPAQPLSPADIRANVAGVLRDPALRTHVRGDVQLRRPAVALHRLLRALSRARPGLRPRARRPGVRHRRCRRGAGAHRLGLARLAPGEARDPACVPGHRHGGRRRPHRPHRSRLADLGRHR